MKLFVYFISYSRILTFLEMIVIFRVMLEMLSCRIHSKTTHKQDLSLFAFDVARLFGIEGCTAVGLQDVCRVYHAIREGFIPFS